MMDSVRLTLRMGPVAVGDGTVTVHKTPCTLASNFELAAEMKLDLVLPEAYLYEGGAQENAKVETRGNSVHLPPSLE